MNLPEWLDRLLSAVYPQRCVICGDVVAYDDYWCGKCERTRIGWIREPCLQAVSGAMAAVEYSGPVRSVVWRVKDRADRRCLGFLADEMLGMLDELCGDTVFDLIVPVPTSRARLEARGFNQAELLAEAVGRGVSVPVLPDALRRREDSETQHDLTAAQRKTNAERSYDLHRAEPVRGKTILLVDDVFTTGATLAACAVRLAEAGAGDVVALTAAMTPLHTS